jgi:RNA polymerase sigma-70 factor (ECF subfamily)
MANDEILVKKAMAGDKDAFGQLVQIYQGAVYGLCYHIVGNFADAQDLAQEAFVQVYQDLHQLREPAKFANWLNRVTRNVCGMWLRRRKSNMVSLDEVALEDFAHSTTSTPLEEIEAEEMNQLVRRAIDALSEKNRLTVTLFYMDGLSHQKIGDFLGVPVSTVKSRLHESRKQLKEELIKMVEKTFEKHKLPKDFADKVLHEVTVRNVQIDPQNDKRLIVFLANKAVDLQQLPIWVGYMEGEAINRVLKREEMPRPMTHDLFINVLREYGIKMTAAIVAEIRGTTFHGRLILESGGVIKEIDSRPSDAIALALRADAPIFVEQSVFQQSGAWFTAFEAGKLPEEFSKQLRGLNQFNLIQKYQEKLRELEASPDEHAEMINLLHWDLAEYCRREGMNDDATRNFERALEHCDNDDQRAYIYRCIGWNYFNSEMYDKAIPVFQKLIEIFPSNVDVLCGLGVSYGRKGIWDEAIPQFQKVLQIDERHTDARKWIADRYFMTQNYEQARTEFQKCTEFRPDWGYARARLADVYETLGQHAEALETMNAVFYLFVFSTIRLSKKQDISHKILTGVSKTQMTMPRSGGFCGLVKNNLLFPC